MEVSFAIFLLLASARFVATLLGVGGEQGG
jgi:hypothetical protein